MAPAPPSGLPQAEEDAEQAWENKERGGGDKFWAAGWIRSSPSQRESPESRSRGESRPLTRRPREVMSPRAWLPLPGRTLRNLPGPRVEKCRHCHSSGRMGESRPLERKHLPGSSHQHFPIHTIVHWMLLLLLLSIILIIMLLLLSALLFSLTLSLSLSLYIYVYTCTTNVSLYVIAIHREGAGHGKMQDIGVCAPTRGTLVWEAGGKAPTAAPCCHRCHLSNRGRNPRDGRRA